MKRIYFEMIDGDICDNYDIAKIWCAVHGTEIDPWNLDSIRKVSKEFKGILKERKRPTVKWFLKHHRKVLAVTYYKDLKNVSLNDAYEFVSNIEQKMREKGEIV